jgi:acetyl/propionyl-CoA carboxylase alpha subunit
MFKKVLIANRGEIAVRVARACRDLGVRAVALYDDSDRGSLHVRLADESVRLPSDALYRDAAALARIAREVGADALHPGYGFLAEHAELARACADAGITFVGPRPEVLDAVRDKIGALERARAAGFDVLRHSDRAYHGGELEELAADAEWLGYPLVVKSCSGGRSHGTRLVRHPAQLEQTVRQAQSAAAAAFGDERVYLEQALLPSRYIEVQVLGDRHGDLVHLSERDGSIQHNHRKLIEESPAPGLPQAVREGLRRRAIGLARQFECDGLCTVEFVLDADGRPFFTEIKARIQVEHPLTEMVTGLDLVREQLRVAAGERLWLSQGDVVAQGVALQCRVNAEDPWNDFLPSPGRLRRFRLPGGPHVRVDTYAYGGCEIPVRYDPLLAKVVVWDEDREACIRRMRRCLEDFAISGVQTNLPLVQRVLDTSAFREGAYDTEFDCAPLLEESVPAGGQASEEALRDLAVAAAIAYLGHSRSPAPPQPERFGSAWHRDSRRLPK